MRALTKKKRVLSTASDDTTIRARKESFKQLQGLARDLFIKHEEGHRGLNLKGPSTRLAIDYAILVITEKGEITMSEEEMKNNLFKRMQAIEEGAE